MVVLSGSLYEFRCLLLSAQPVVFRWLEPEELQNSSAKGPNIAKICEVVEFAGVSQFPHRRDGSARGFSCPVCHLGVLEEVRTDHTSGKFADG